MLIFLLLASLTYINFALKRDFSYPPFVFSLLWSLVTLFHLISNVSGFMVFPDFSFETIAILLIGNFLFSAGGIIAYSINLKGKEKLKKKYSVHKWADYLLLGLSIGFLPLFIIKAFQIQQTSEIESFFIGLRTQLNYGGYSYGYLSYLLIFSYFNLFFRLSVLKFKNNIKAEKFKLSLSFLVALTYGVLATGRTFIVMIVLFILALYLLDKKFSFKKVLIFTTLFVIVFSSFAILLGKGYSGGKSLGANVESVAKSFSLYIIGPTSAMNSYDFSEGSNGKMTLRFFNVILYKAGLVEEIPTDLKLKASKEAGEVNVYTIFFHYFSDFKWFGMLFILLYGIVLSFIYRLAKRDFLIYRFLYALTFYPLVMSFFQDQFLSLFSTWIQFLIYSVVFFELAIIRKK